MFRGTDPNEKITIEQKDYLIEGLKCCSSFDDNKCFNCPYDRLNDAFGADCQRILATDALELLKNDLTT